MSPAETQVYLAAARFRVLEVLERGPSTVEVLAQACDPERPYAYHLANCCGGLYVIDYSPGTVGTNNVSISLSGQRLLENMRAERVAESTAAKGGS